ncbi:nucleotide exchange factor GrpE [Thermoanaerobacterium thermosaccharolyticum]|uniref:Protein GrpE n=1 Tax=Thermoanaerobacterium thermosaccharolyticum (strain ATCC 7956 / DSM 571 / NCIMB 9385 / NCA 3814 / NCTC 13789 / WDCM 00135 / 2032) TaxID=580327 RepID=D9TP84_THETC|nr:nucleotide exchange factor GrpE [Thermoanaerobacterium thermosaccharolyticum]ADL68703.1 GrpE protein [Thermoanaerobacterium thermosaccharolyticum DSM 571]MBE0069533.1 nucleotide exchange factor GrpE [Thermoanaerobacterium thermosaccharolyticum]MBE0229214.1 nucleotide exchange factor GrpE [Thermoanaerobacterium thermosaccharolyticum]TCW42014.1 molecular chaperone GrpE [Thermohydrogenium kirishiense]
MDKEKDTIEYQTNEEENNSAKDVSHDNENLSSENSADIDSSHNTSEDEKNVESDNSNEEKNNDEGEIEELKNRLKQKEEEANEYLEMAQRLKAEFENYRRRTEKEKADLIEYGKEQVILDILPVIDNFERALETQYDDNGENASFKEGINLIYRQFKGILEKMGVKEIESLGQMFDPYKHHAVMQEEAEGKKENEIIEVFQKGYMFNNKVIRPSMVKVAK